ncbi:hypothetical protein [Lacinutrix sp. MEBiC02404]
MKKIFLNLLVVILFIGLNSCSQDDSSTSLISPEYGKDVKLSPINNKQTRLDDESKIIIVKLGRKSKNCIGFGFCRVCVACGTARVDGDILEIPVNEYETGEFVELHLDYELGDEFDSNIYIDEDLYDEDTG